MGRNEAPLERDGTAAVELAYWLRELRREAGLTYPEMAAITNYAASSLQGACSGRRLPSKKITLAIVASCDGDLAAWSEYWSRLRRAGTDSEVDVRPPWLESAGTSQVGSPAVVRTDDGQPDEPALDAGTIANLPTIIDQTHPANSGRRHRLAWLGSVAASFAVGILVGHQFVQNSGTVSATVPATPLASLASLSWARESAKDGAPSLADPRDNARPGPGVPYGEPVQLSCELHLGVDDDWYLVASRPWQGEYYAPATDFTSEARGVPAC